MLSPYLEDHVHRLIEPELKGLAQEDLVVDDEHPRPPSLEGARRVITVVRLICVECHENCPPNPPTPVRLKLTSPAGSNPFDGKQLARHLLALDRGGAGTQGYRPPLATSKAPPPKARRSKKADGGRATRPRAEDATNGAADTEDGEDAFEAEVVGPADDGEFEEVAQVPEIVVATSKERGLSRLDPLETYMREVQAHKLLSPEEERTLAVRYTETQDVDAAARLVTAHLRLVVKIAYEYRRAYRNMMDLIQEGNMGLMQAVKKYDPYRGVKLSSYAAWWIRAYMLRYILANWRLVKLGTTQAQRKLFFNLNKEKARLSAMGIEPSNAEIARRLEVTESDVDEMEKRLARGDASLDAPVNEGDGRQISRVEMLPGPGTSPEQVNEGAELSHLVREHLDQFRGQLAGKDLIIFDERLVADEPRTLQDLGEQFGVSRERVRQLEARLTGRLRDYLSERLGDAVQMG